MSGIKLCSSIKKAEKLYKKFVKKPKNALHLWETRKATFDAVKDNVFFLYNENVLIPLQLTSDGTIEWFGGSLIGDNNWIIVNEQDPLSASVQEELASFINVFSNIDNMINNICSPVYGYTDLSSFPMYHLKFSNYQSWFTGLDKDRKYECQQAKKIVKEHVTLNICEEDLRIFLDVAAKIRAGIEECTPQEIENDSFHRNLKKLLLHAREKSRVDSVFYTRIDDQNNEIIALALCFRDWVDPSLYHYVFSTIDEDIAPFLDRLIINGVIALADNRSESGPKITKINTPSDEISPDSPSNLMGLSYNLYWCTKTMIDGYRSGDDNDEEEDDLLRIHQFMEIILSRFCIESVIKEAIEYFESEGDSEIGLEIINAATAIFTGNKITNFSDIEQYMLDNDIVEQEEED